MFKLNWVNVKSALVYGFVTLALVFIISAGEGIIKHGSIFGVDWKTVLDGSSMSVLSLFVSFVSIVKNFLTTNKGDFLGVVEVVPEKQ